MNINYERQSRKSGSYKCSEDRIRREQQHRLPTDEENMESSILL